MKRLFKKICIASDHAGFKLKEYIKDFLINKNISIIDQGKIVKTSSMKSLLKELESEIYVFEMKQTVPHDLKLDNLKINKIDANCSILY